MALHKIAGILLGLTLSTALWADTLKINPHHPDRYTVVKGDTLWDISAKFLQNPWEWPKLWKNNPQIKDPHWIYPGDILYFSIVNGQPQLSLTRPGDDNELDPRIRVHPLEDAIEMIPSDAIRQFLTSPKVVTDDEMEKAPYVIDFAGEHLLAGAGDRVYVRAITEPESLTYIVYRKGKAYVSPDSPEILGYEALSIAEATLQSTGDPATLAINHSDSEVRMGDRLMVSSAGNLDLNYYPHPPAQTIKGNIISVLNGVSQIGQHNIVVIDKGTSDGIETGHVFDIYRRGRTVVDRIGNPDKASKVKLPDEIAGQLLVFRPFKHVSYALVMEASAAIHVLDRIETP